MIIHIEDITTLLDIAITIIIIIIQTEVDLMYPMLMVEEISINQVVEIIIKEEGLKQTEIIIQIEKK